MLGEHFFELALKLAVGTFHITSMWPHRWSKNMRFTAGQRPCTGFVRYEHAGIATHVVLPDYLTPIIILFVSSSAIGQRTTDAVER